MVEEPQSGSEMTRLPREAVDWLNQPFARFLRIEAASGALLLLFTAAALALSNSPWSHPFLSTWDTPIGFSVGSFEFGRSLRDWLNDGLMTLFFFVVALELKRELVLGELKNPRMAALSIAAALGGMLVPAGLYLALLYGQPGAHGWGVVMATDTAFAVGCLAILGSRVPQSLRIFILSLAIVDDIGAILVVAIGYSGPLNWAALALGGLGLAAVRGMALLGIRSVPIYFLIGALVWLAVDASGVHATITGVILGLMAPTRRWVSDERLQGILNKVVSSPGGEQGSSKEDRKALYLAKIAVRETLSPVERLEIGLHPWIGFAVVPLFAFANAGVPISFGDFGNPITMAVFVGFVLGKPIGIVAFSWLAVRSGIAIRPPNLSWRMLAASSLLAGIGFTMALFISNLAFSESHINAAKLGIFSASAIAAAAGVAFLAWFSRPARASRR